MKKIMYVIWLIAISLLVAIIGLVILGKVISDLLFYSTCFSWIATIVVSGIVHKKNNEAKVLDKKRKLAKKI